MTILFTSTEPVLSNNQLIELKQKLDVDLPLDYREFLMGHNVAIPQRNIITKGTLTASITEFFGLCKSENSDILEVSNTFYNRVPVTVLPIARAEGGNLICLEKNTGQIFFWDHEEEAEDGHEPTYGNMLMLASSFTEFLEQIKPYEPETIDPEMVISVKKKPGFSEKFKDYLKN